MRMLFEKASLFLVLVSPCCKSSGIAPNANTPETQHVRLALTDLEVKGIQCSIDLLPPGPMARALLLETLGIPFESYAETSRANSAMVETIPLSKNHVLHFLIEGLCWKKLNRISPNLSSRESQAIVSSADCELSDPQVMVGTLENSSWLHYAIHGRGKDCRSCVRCGD